MSKRKMKDSGVEWLGEIPAEWDVDRIGSFYQHRNEKVSDKGYAPLSVTMKGVVPQLETAAKSDDGDNRKLVRKGDFAINSRSDRRGSCGISFYDGSVSLINTILTPRGQMDPCYYNWLFHTQAFADEYYKWGHGIVDDLWTTRWSEMKRISIPRPTLSAQRKIAEYLDARCAKIDEMVSDAKKTIEEYKAWKASVIFESVTGKNTGSKMKDSGVEWIGRMPDGWRVIPVRYLLVEKNVRSEAGLEEPLSMSQVHGVVPSKMITVANPASSYVGAKVVSVGDLVFNKLKAHLGVFAISRYAGLVSPDYAVYQSRGICDMSLLMWAFHTPQCISEFKKNVTGIGAGLSRLYTSDLYRIKVPVPSVEEQLRLVDFLAKKCAAIDRVIAGKEALMADLEAYKKSLIFECVTGKMEVA